MNESCKFTSDFSQLPYITNTLLKTIIISNPKIEVKSIELWGTLRVLQTLVINESTVKDSPHLPCISSFSSNSTITQDAMALVKMNVFHWHITDDSSFPYQSSTYPQLSQKGAYHPIKLVYGDGIVGQLLNYARLRGIRVLVEFDTPSHTRSWEKGHPGLRTKCYTEGSPNGETGPFDPTNQTTMGFLTSFFNEITSKFRERFIHLGGGDISFECWQSNPDIVNFMKTKGFGEDYGKLESYYFEELIKAIQSVQQKKGPITPVVWEDTFHNGYRPKDQNPVFQVWDESNRQERVRNITSAGYRVILSSCFLISAKNYVGHWYSYYECDPRDFSGRILSPIVTHAMMPSNAIHPGETAMVKHAEPPATTATFPWWLSLNTAVGRQAKLAGTHVPAGSTISGRLLG
ncbi:unnamed protein product [Trichobilharzia regenti]|nr:unnamed protein product [Trichobilharzia regenti]